MLDCTSARPWNPNTINNKEPTVSASQYETVQTRIDVPTSSNVITALTTMQGLSTRHPHQTGASPKGPWYTSPRR